MTTTAPPLPPAPAEAATEPPAVEAPQSAVRQAAITALVAALVTAWLFRHVLAHPGAARVAGNPGDVALYSWWIQHGASAAFHGPRALLFTRSLNAPFGVNAVWNTSMVLPSVLLAPLTELAGPLATFNFLLVSSPVLTAAVAHALLRRLVRRDAAARVGALLWAFCPALLAADLGHLSLVFTPLSPRSCSRRTKPQPVTGPGVPGSSWDCCLRPSSSPARRSCFRPGWSSRSPRSFSRSPARSRSTSPGYDGWLPRRPWLLPRSWPFRHTH